MNKKYPIGTKIIYKPTSSVCCTALQDIDKQGRIVGYGFNKVEIHLPGSRNNFHPSKGEKEITWRCRWEHIQLVKNQQLEFAFMSATGDT